jgi:hypothetical protein
MMIKVIPKRGLVDCSCPPEHPCEQDEDDAKTKVADNVPSKRTGKGEKRRRDDGHAECVPNFAPITVKRQVTACPLCCLQDGCSAN